MSAVHIELTPHLLNLWKSNWLEILENPVVEIIFKSLCNNTPLNLSTIEPTQVFTLAIASLQAFVQENFVGPDIDSYECISYFELISSLNAKHHLDVDDVQQVNANASRCELLYLSKILFKHLLNEPATEINNVMVKWWYIRYLYIHNEILNEPSSVLYKEFTIHSDYLQTNLNKIPCSESRGLLLLEIVQGYLTYKRIFRVEPYLEQAKQLLGINVEVTGILGKRTKYQVNAVAQSVLKMEILADQNSAHQTHGKTELPILLSLDDDVRLEKIKFENEDENVYKELSTIRQLLVLALL